MPSCSRKKRAASRPAKRKPNAVPIARSKSREAHEGDGLHRSIRAEIAGPSSVPQEQRQLHSLAPRYEPSAAGKYRRAHSATPSIHERRDPGLDSKQT